MSQDFGLPARGTRVRTPTGVEGVVSGTTANRVLVQPPDADPSKAQWWALDQIEMITEES